MDADVSNGGHNIVVRQAGFFGASAGGHGEYNWQCGIANFRQNNTCAVSRNQRQCLFGDGTANKGVDGKL